MVSVWFGCWLLIDYFSCSANAHEKKIFIGIRLKWSWFLLDEFAVFHAGRVVLHGVTFQLEFVFEATGAAIEMRGLEWACGDWFEGGC